MLYRDCTGKIKGVIDGKLITLALDRDPCKLYLMFLSQEIDVKLCQIYTKIQIFIFNKYATNLKTKIFQRNLIVI